MSIKFVVEYRCDHAHIVRVGIIAKDEDEAVRLAESMMDAGTLHQDTSEVPLLMDEFEELDNGPIEFNVVDILPANFPEPDASVVQLRTERLAMRVCDAMVKAYKRGDRSGSVSWEELDLVHELALEVVNGKAGMNPPSLPKQAREDADGHLIVSLDGGQTFLPAPSGVRLVRTKVISEENEAECELHFNFTGEGLVSDVWSDQPKDANDNVATLSETFEEMVERLIENADV
jgi:hypothetical protein